MRRQQQQQQQQQRIMYVQIKTYEELQFGQYLDADATSPKGIEEDCIFLDRQGVAEKHYKIFQQRCLETAQSFRTEIVLISKA